MHPHDKEKCTPMKSKVEVILNKGNPKVTGKSKWPMRRWRVTGRWRRSARKRSTSISVWWRTTKHGAERQTRNRGYAQEAETEEWFWLVTVEKRCWA